MYYDIKKMCRKSSPMGEGTGEGPAGVESCSLFFFPSPPLLFKKINRIFAEKLLLARCRDRNVKDRKDGRGAGN